MYKFNFTGCVVKQNVKGSRQINLRETKKFWIGEDGSKFYKDFGRQYGKTYADYKLDLETIQQRPTS